MKMLPFPSSTAKLKRKRSLLEKVTRVNTCIQKIRSVFILPDNCSRYANYSNTCFFPGCGYLLITYEQRIKILAEIHDENEYSIVLGEGIEQISNPATELEHLANVVNDNSIFANGKSIALCSDQGIIRIIKISSNSLTAPISTYNSISLSEADERITFVTQHSG